MGSAWSSPRTGWLGPGPSASPSSGRSTSSTRRATSNRQARPAPSTSVEVADHAAVSCPVEVKERMMDWWGPGMLEYYAGTELNGCWLVKPEDWLARPGTVGQPLIGEIHILDEEGNEQPPCEAGTIYFGGGPPYEYHNAPDKTESSKDPGGHGWTTLGDVGYLDEDGWLFLTDRKAFMIISGGVNIYPQEIEDCLVMHQKVADVAVFGAGKGVG